MENNLDPMAESGASPAPPRFSMHHHAIARGLGIHFDESAPGTPGDSSASPAPAGAPAGNGAPPAPGSAGGPPPPPPESPNVRQLREQYESTKGQLEPWTKLGVKPEEASAHIQLMTKMSGEAAQLGMGLGYTEAEIQDAFKLDPVKTLQFLRNEQAKNGTQRGTPAPDFSKLLKEQMDKELKPIRDREQQRALKEANAIVTREFDSQIKTAFPEGIASEVGDAIYDVMVGMLESDKDAFGRIVNDGKASDVQKYFSEAKNRVLKVLTAWSKHETDRVSGTTQRQNGNGNTNTNTRTTTNTDSKKGWGLDRMINGEFPPGMSVSKR